MSGHEHTLSDWLGDGQLYIGQVRIVPDGRGGYSLTHERDDASDPALEIHTGPQAARQIVTLDSDGAFRPLKSAPNLRRRWKLQVSSISELKQSLDFIYPAAIGLAISLQKGILQANPLRDTLNRQTGMYRVAGKISDGDANRLVGEVCQSQSGCLRHILWPVSESMPLTSLDHVKISAPDIEASVTKKRSVPLLCCEACPLLVAAAREHVKSEQNKPTDATRKD